MVFSKNNLVKIPYTFDGQNLIKINFDTSEGFQILTTKDINIEPFSSIRLKFKFSCHLNQLLIFEQNDKISGLGSDMPPQLPNFYQYEEIILHNLQNSPFLYLLQ